MDNYVGGCLEWDWKISRWTHQRFSIGRSRTSGNNVECYEYTHSRSSCNVVKLCYGNTHKRAPLLMYLQNLLTLRWPCSYQDTEVVWQVCNTKWLWLPLYVSPVPLYKLPNMNITVSRWGGFPFFSLSHSASVRLIGWALIMFVCMRWKEADWCRTCLPVKSGILKHALIKAGKTILKKVRTNWFGQPSKWVTIGRDNKQGHALG